MVRNALLAIVLLTGGISAMAAPLDDFKKIVSTCKANLGSVITQKAEMKSRGKWVKRRFEIGDILYDVQTTNSLVSPAVAFIRVNYLAANVSASTEAEIDAMEVTIAPPYIIREVVINYAFADGAWILKGGKMSTRFVMSATPDGARPMIETKTPSQLTVVDTVEASCIGAPA